MAINLKESFRVNAPPDKVWQFLLDPQQVVLCMPGAELNEVVGEDTFLGSVKVRVGPITATYKGRAQFAEVDRQTYSIRIVAEGVEAGGGNARGTMFSRLQPLPDGGTEVWAEATAEISGRVMQFGRGMVQGISKELFQEFARNVTQRLETPVEGGAPPPPQRPINAVALVIGYIWSAVVRFLRRLFGRR